MKMQGGSLNLVETGRIVGSDPRRYLEKGVLKSGFRWNIDAIFDADVIQMLRLVIQHSGIADLPKQWVSVFFY